MPFRSRAQIGKCFALAKRGANGTWNCIDWAHKTGMRGGIAGKRAYAHLPQKIKTVKRKRGKK